jgi:ATP-dependent helicase/DNAse subunit B
MTSHFEQQSFFADHEHDITLLTGPAGCGKTAYVLQLVHEAPRRGWSLLLLPDRLQQKAVKARSRRIGRARLQTYQFAALAGRLLHLAGSQVVQLDAPLQDLLLRGVLRELVEQQRLVHFAAIAQKPGFVATIGQLLTEAQNAEVPPDRLAQAAVTPYDAELGVIYAAYLEALHRQNLADSAHRLKLATDALQQQPDMLHGLDLLVVDGFSQFTPLQLRLLQALTRCARRTYITLTGDQRERLAHRRFLRTRDALHALLPSLQTVFCHAEQQPAAMQGGGLKATVDDGQQTADEHRTPVADIGPFEQGDSDGKGGIGNGEAWERGQPARPKAGEPPVLPGSYRFPIRVQGDGGAEEATVLAFLEANLFELDTPAPLPADEVLTVIEAADREREVRAVLRRVRTLLAQGTPPEQVAILFRKGNVYSSLLREVANEYRLPLALYEGLPLLEAPAVQAFLTLLRLPLANYPRRSLVEVWRSFADGRLRGFVPAVSEDGEGDHAADEAQQEQPKEQPLVWVHQPQQMGWAASILDRCAREGGVTGGVARLRAALAAAARPPDEEADVVSATEEPVYPGMFTHEDAAKVLQIFEAFHAWLKPPAKASVTDFVTWVQERLALAGGEPATDAPAGENDGASTTAGQTSVFRRWKAMLERFARAATRLQELPLPYSSFVSEITAQLAAARYGRAEPAPGSVAVLPVLAARGLSFAHVLLIGMGEGEFPQTLQNPPLYSRRERALLCRQGIPLVASDPSDERSLFYEALTRARGSLTLSRTYLDERGNPLPPSPYLTALLQLLVPGRFTRIVAGAGSSPAWEEAASPQEALIALMERSGGVVENEPLPSAAAGAAVSPVLLAHVRRVCHVEQFREGLEEYGPFEGMVQDDVLIAQLAEHFGSAYHWSVSQFNTYTTCPFRFVAAYVLHLEQRLEPEEGLERAARGRIYHDVLAQAGEDWIRAQHVFAEADEEPILADLHQAIDRVLADAPTRYSFAPGSFWLWEQADIRRRLVQAVRRMVQEGGDWSAFRPLAVEQGFGTRRGAEPLKLETPHGEVLVVGRVDRIDRRQDGVLALLDYKSSSGVRRLKDTLQGVDVQLAVYLLAVERMLHPGHTVARSAFFHLGSGKFSPALTDKKRDQAVEAMQERVAETVRAVRSGVYPVRPREACPTGCAFARICRLNIRKRAQCS